MAAAGIEVAVEGLNNIKTFGSAMQIKKGKIFQKQKIVAIIVLQLHNKVIHLVMILLLLPVHYSILKKFIVKTYPVVLKLKTMKKKTKKHWL